MRSVFLLLGKGGRAIRESPLRWRWWLRVKSGWWGNGSLTDFFEFDCAAKDVGIGIDGFA